MPVAPVNGVDLYYNVQGKGEPLLLIMGLGGPRQSWFLQVRAFRRHYQVITFDNRGVGQTDDGGRPFTVRAMVEDTIALLDHLSIDSAHVLGYSLGGIVAQLVAAEHPERVRKLILASTTPLGLGHEEATPEVVQALGVEQGGAEIDPAGDLSRNPMPAIVDLAFGKRGYRAILRPLARLYARPSWRAGLRRQVEAVTNVATYNSLSQILAPTLVMTGADDRIVSPAGSVELADKIHHSRLVIVEGGSHAFALEMSGRFNREVLQFLRSG